MTYIIEVKRTQSFDLESFSCFNKVGSNIALLNDKGSSHFSTR
jgi:hypothetical protein